MGGIIYSDSIKDDAVSKEYFSSLLFQFDGTVSHKRGCVTYVNLNVTYRIHLFRYLHNIVRIFSLMFKIISVLNGILCHHISVCSYKEMLSYLSLMYTPATCVMRLKSQPLSVCQLQLQSFVFDFLIRSPMVDCRKLKHVAGFILLTM